MEDTTNNNSNKRQKREDSAISNEEKKSDGDEDLTAFAACPECSFPVRDMKSIPFSKLAEHKDQWTMQDNTADDKKMCSACERQWKEEATKFCNERESGLVDPFYPKIFPGAMFQYGGVPVKTMAHLIAIKQALMTDDDDTPAAAAAAGGSAATPTASGDETPAAASSPSKRKKKPGCMKRFGKLNYTRKNGSFFYFVEDKSTMVPWFADKDLNKYPSQEARQTLIDFAEHHVQNLLPLGAGGYRADPGFVMTQKADVQAPHRDYKKYHDLYDNDIDKAVAASNISNSVGLGDYRNVTKPETQFLPWVLHLPIVKEGMWLNYWPDAMRDQPPVRFHIPFGTFLMLRVDAVHGGIFGKPGNVRLHIAFTPVANTIQKKGTEWIQEQKTRAAASSDNTDAAGRTPLLTEAVVKKHKKLGAPEAGIEQRELDKLEDYRDYYQTGDVNECNRDYEYKATFHEDDEYQRRLREHCAETWNPSALDNLTGF